MFRLAHLSDIHLGPLPAVTYRQLASKRITGYVNWHRNRSKLMHDGVTDALLADMHREGTDHIAVTGDLTNLALEIEIDAARQWLEQLGTPHDVSIVPGNHDAYVPGAIYKACRAWRPWIGGEKATIPTNENGFPYLRRRGPAAIIGVNSARATAPFMASGHLGSLQAGRLGRLLDLGRKEGRFRVILIHHPPVRGAAPAHKRLYGIGLFQRIVARHGAELVIHGHTHLPTLNWIDGRDGCVPVVGVTAAGQGSGGHKPPAQYNLYEIAGEAGKWSLRLTRRGLTGKALAIARIEQIDLAGRALPEAAAAE